MNDYQDIIEALRDLMKAKAGESLTIIPTEKFPELSISEAYAVQFKTMATRVNRGEVVVGWKAAATNKAVQEKPAQVTIAV